MWIPMMGNLGTSMALAFLDARRGSQMGPGPDYTKHLLRGRPGSALRDVGIAAATRAGRA